MNKKPNKTCKAIINGGDQELAELLKEFNFVGKTVVTTTGKPRRLNLRLVEDVPTVKLSIAK